MLIVGIICWHNFYETACNRDQQNLLSTKLTEKVFIVLLDKPQFVFKVDLQYLARPR